MFNTTYAFPFHESFSLAVGLAQVNGMNYFNLWRFGGKLSVH